MVSQLPSCNFLVFHGSRDRRPQSILSKLIPLIHKQLAFKIILAQRNYSKQQQYLCSRQNICEYPVESIALAGNIALAIASDRQEISLIETSSLEFTQVPLHKNIEQYARSVQKLGYNHLKILPLFLAPGVHVCEDIPTEVAKVKSLLAQTTTVELLPYLGDYPQTWTTLSKQWVQLPSDGKILLAHGTRYPQGNVWLKNLATRLNARIAYYSISDSLPEQIEDLISKKINKIAIIPYFLFPGRITETIATKVAQLQQAFPQVQLLLGKPLGTTEEFANLIVEVLTK